MLRLELSRVERKFIFWSNSKKFFDIYSTIFDTVEINNTFYKFPTEEKIRKWKKESPDNFIFSIKANRILTHSKSRFQDKDKLKLFYSIISKLENKLGCVLFQLPPYCKYDKKLLDDIVDNLDYNYKNVIEFRHPSWWKQSVYKVFKDNNIIFCNVSSPMKNEIEIYYPADDLFIRFHGVNQWYNHNYSESELKSWIQEIKEKGTKRIWAYFNNTNNGDAAYNAIRFKELLIN